MKNKFKQLIFFVFAIVAAVSLSVAEASQEPVIIGVPLPLTGNLKEFGMMMKKGKSPPYNLPLPNCSLQSR